MKNKLLKQITLNIVLTIISLLVIFPIIWMLSTAFKLPKEYFTQDLRLVPHRPTLNNFISVWSSYPIIYWFYNTLMISIFITLGQVLGGILAAYCFVRYTFPGKNLLFMVIIGTLIIPFQVTMVPNYITVSKMRLLNTWWGVVFPYLARAGFATFLLRQFMRTIPRDMFSAAEIDGASSWKTLWAILVPNIRSGIVVVTIVVFIQQAWNIYIWPLIVLTDQHKRTLAIGIRSFMDVEAGYQWGELMAAATLAMIPTLIIYFIAQKQIIGSFVTSGVKG